MNCSDIKDLILGRGWVTAMSKVYVKKAKDTEPTSHRNNLENGPDNNEGQGRRHDTFREQHNDRERKTKTDKNTTRVKSKNKIGDSDTCRQTNRRRNRGVILHELSNISDNNLSDVTRMIPMPQNNVSRPQRRIRKPLIKNTEPSIYYICGNPNIPQNPNTDTGNISILLPNQVDYS